MAEELLDANGMTEAEFLAEYKKKQYPGSYLTADVTLFCIEKEKPEILLIKRGNHPCLGKRALPGGFVNRNENARTAAVRELEEETGVAGIQPEAVGFYSNPDRDPRGWIVTEAYCSIQKKKPLAKAADDARDARWFEITETIQKEEMILTLQAADEIITITAQLAAAPVTGNRAAVAAKSENLAFDHAQVIADAWMKIRKIIADA